MWIIFFPLALIVIFTIIFKKMYNKDRKHTSRKDVGPYFIEDSQLFLNAPPPQRVQAVPLDEVGHVEIFHDYGEIKQNTRFTITMTIIKKDGTRGKGIFFTFWMTQRTAPEDISAALKADGISCAIVINKK